MLKPLYFFYYTIEGACMFLQSKIFGRYMNTTAGYSVLRSLAGIMALKQSLYKVLR